LYSLSAFSENQGVCQIAVLSTAAEEQRAQFKALNVTVPSPFVYHVELNRPKKLNAMDNTMWL
jgi:enoyl-CoA hydratase/carnithine racemase